jgi:hypothetical protein
MLVGPPDSCQSLFARRLAGILIGVAQHGWPPGSAAVNSEGGVRGSQKVQPPFSGLGYAY